MKLSQKQIYENAIGPAGKKIQLLKDFSEQLQAMPFENGSNLVKEYFQTTINLKPEDRGFDEQSAHNLTKHIYDQFLSICNSSSTEVQKKRKRKNDKFNSLTENFAQLKVTHTQRATFERMLEDLISQEIKRASDEQQNPDPHVTFKLIPTDSQNLGSRFCKYEAIEFYLKQTVLFTLKTHGVSDTSPKNLAHCAGKAMSTRVAEGNLLFIKALATVVKKHPTQVSLTLEKNKLDNRSVKYLVDIIQSGKCLSLDVSHNNFSAIGKAFIIMANYNNPSCKVWLTDKP